MRIAVNTRFLLHGKLEGIGWFTHEILRRMVEQHPEHEFVFFFDRPFHADFIFGKNVTPVVLQPPARHPVLFLIWFEWSVRRALKKYKADIFISTDGMLCLGTKVPTLLVIHDLAFVHYPKHLPFKFRFFLNYFTPKYAKRADHIVTVSTFSKTDLVQQYSLSEQKIDVVFNGAHKAYQVLSFEERQQIKEKYAMGCEYFVFAGALHPRKNVENLLKAFAVFKARQQSNMKILIVGRFAWNADAIQQEMKQNRFKEDIIHYDYMQVDELSKVIGAAYALTFVSLFEGFGIPVLEALQCSVPVIASDRTSIPEVAGDAALYANPEDVQEIANVMMQLYKDEHLHTVLSERCLTQASKFNWDLSAEKMFSIIQHMLIAR
ncbi:MAG: glycosyltransferase family 4 protein [Chitinophagaceae bacterium]|nr:glycosyltransferase family 4 protein [Chitinophagaceae bacterium]